MAQDLTHGTVFVVFCYPDTRAVDVTLTIIKSLSAEESKIDLVRETIQTYDGSKNMQSHLSGVQQRIKDRYCHFAENLYCNNYIMQLSINGTNNCYILVGRKCDNCRIIVKILNYSPKRTSRFVKVK